VNRERLTAYLKPEHREAGFHLEGDEDFVYLKQGDKVLAVWNATKVTIQVILDEADGQIGGTSNVLPTPEQA